MKTQDARAGRDSIVEVKPDPSPPLADPRRAIMEWFAWRVFRLSTVFDCWPLPDVDLMRAPTPVLESQTGLLCFLGRFASTDLTRLVMDGAEARFESAGRGSRALAYLGAVARNVGGTPPQPAVTAAQYATNLAQWVHDRLPGPPTSASNGKWPTAVLAWCDMVWARFYPLPEHQRAVWQLSWLDLYASNGPELEVYRPLVDQTPDSGRAYAIPLQVPDDAPPQVYGWVTSALTTGGDTIATPPPDAAAQSAWLEELNSIVDDM